MHTSIMKMVLGLPSRYLVTAILTVSALAVDGGGPFLSAADLTIRLLGDKAIQRQVVSYSCDTVGTQIGLPASPFSVEYFSGSGNHLAAIPLFGNTLIFSNVSSASGARYAAQQYIWWEANGGATLYFESIAGAKKSICQRAHAVPDPRPKDTQR